MRKLLTMKVLTSVLLVLMVAGFAQAQFITGTVTEGPDNIPVPLYDKLLLTIDGDTIKFVKTDADGNYVQRVAPTLTYTITNMDTFKYEPYSVDIDVPDFNDVTQDIHFDYRVQDDTLTGTVSAEDGSDVAGMMVYFIKLPNEIDITDFTKYETHFEVPKLGIRFASYSVEVDAQGDFILGMLYGNYVVFMESGETTLAHWGVMEFNSNTQPLDIVLKEKKSISGMVGPLENLESYDFIQILGHSLNAGRPITATPDPSTGAYAMNAAPGEYIVRLQAFFEDEEGNNHMYMVFYDGVYSVDEATVVDVQDHVTGIDFDLPAAEVYPYSVSGTVTSEDTGNPIANAHVSFVSYNMYVNLWQWHHDSTDEKGNYTIEGQTILPEDSLLGFSWADGFFGEFYDNAATHVNATPIVFHPNDDITGIDFALDSLDTTNAHSISGTLYDEEGNIVPQGQVTAFTNAANVGVYSVQVDSNGMYNFGPIFPEGSTVYLQAWGGYNYLVSIYDNAETWEDATPIEIGTSDISGINFHLVSKAPARFLLAEIRGLIGLGNAKAGEVNALEGAVIYVKPQGAAEWTNVSSVDNDGNFSLGVEEDGFYEIKVTARGYQTYEDNSVEVKDREANLPDITLSPTAIGDTPSDPVIRSHKLFTAYPNPFNPSTTIRVDMANAMDVSLVIYNVIGQKIKTLHSGMLSAGTTTFKWNAVDNAGAKVASGLYFYQLKTQNTMQTKAVMFIK